MHFTWLTTKSFVYSILLHSVAVGLLVLSVQNEPKTVQTPIKEVDVVTAVAVDNKQVELELQQLKDIEDDKQKKQKELEKKVKDLKQKRKSEERKLAIVKKKKTSEEKKLAEARKKKLAEEEKLKQAEKKRRQEEEKKRLAEAKKKQEAEEALKIQLAEKQKQRQQEQARQDSKLLQNIISDIYRSVVSNFNKSGLPNGLECTLTVRLIPSGDVINISLNHSSNNELFDRRAIVAIKKASPLPVPNDVVTFDRLKLRNFNLVFKPED